MTWTFSQVFGEPDSSEEPADGKTIVFSYLSDIITVDGPPALAEDLISSVQFDASGEYLATGDRGGRVVIFESSEVPV